MLALPAGFLFDQRRLPGLAATVLVLVAVGFSLTVASIWSDEPPDERGNTMAMVTALAIASTQTAALAARRREHDPKAVRRLFAASAALALVLAAMVTVAAWSEISSSGYFRVLAALAVLDVLVVALQPILALTRPGGVPYRLRVLVEPGEVVETTVEAPDLGAAAAKAIRTIEGGGRQVTGVERLKQPGWPAAKA